VYVARNPVPTVLLPLTNVIYNWLPVDVSVGME